MPRTLTASSKVLILFSLFGMCVLLVGFSGDPHNAQLLKQARERYYSLRKEGMKGFFAIVQPNWKLYLATFDVAKRDSLLNILQPIQLMMKLDSTGEVRIEHWPEPPMTGNRENDFVYSAEQSLKGFFTTWKQFALTPFSEDLDSTCRVEKKGDKYIISSLLLGDTESMTLSHDLIVESIDARSVFIHGIMNTRFANNPYGFLLTDIEGTFVQNKDGATTASNYHIDYEEIHGLELPKTVKLTASQKGMRIELEYSFSDHEVAMK